jgi:hypothetical protein
VVRVTVAQALARCVPLPLGNVFRNIVARGSVIAPASWACLPLRFQPRFGGEPQSHPRSPNAERSTPGGAYHPAEP